MPHACPECTYWWVKTGSYPVRLRGRRLAGIGKKLPMYTSCTPVLWWLLGLYSGPIWGVAEAELLCMAWTGTQHSNAAKGPPIHHRSHGDASIFTVLVAALTTPPPPAIKTASKPSFPDLSALSSFGPFCDCIGGNPLWLLITEKAKGPRR